MGKGGSTPRFFKPPPPFFYLKSIIPKQEFSIKIQRGISHSILKSSPRNFSLHFKSSPLFYPPFLSRKGGFFGNKENLGSWHGFPWAKTGYSAENVRFALQSLDLLLPLFGVGESGCGLPNPQEFFPYPLDCGHMNSSE